MIINTKHYITIRQFADKVKKSPQLIRHYVNQGRIKSVPVGDQMLIHKDEVKNYPPEQRPLGRRPHDAPNV